MSGPEVNLIGAVPAAVVPALIVIFWWPPLVAVASLSSFRCSFMMKSRRIVPQVPSSPPTVGSLTMPGLLCRYAQALARHATAMLVEDLKRAY